MSDADRINALLQHTAPAAWRCLSELGRRAVFPRGIPFQSAQAKQTEINATIGQITDGAGGPLPLGELATLATSFEPTQAFLYSPQSGHMALREAWAARQRRFSEGCEATRSTPLVTHGLTQGVSLVADLFADSDTDYVVTAPCWENYNLLFTLRKQARKVSYPAYDGDGFNIAGLEHALGSVRGKAVLVLNFPGNPTGYTPTRDEAEAIVEVVTRHPGPLVVLVDDAYHRYAYEPELMRRSIFWDLLEAHDPERQFVVRIDGATKELLFFPGRVGFLTHGGDADVEEAMTSKLMCLGRGTVGSPPGPSQAMVLAALRQPGLEASIDTRIQEMRTRYDALRHALRGLESPTLRPLPFNSGLFALVALPQTLDADRVRETLIEQESVGTIYIPEINGLRIAFCSVHAENIPEVVRRLDRTVKKLSTS